MKLHSLTRTDDFDNAQADGLTAALAHKRSPSPEGAAMTEERNSQVMQALAELDDDFRLVVVLRDVEDMDYSAISQVLDVPVGTVKSRLHRARLMLKSKLERLMHP
jgi:RNA polymerase sigma-70 factor (ECF subfamily)